MKKVFILIVMLLGMASLSFGQWVQQGIGLDWANARWISIVDANTAYFAADYGGSGTKIYKTINGGSTWSLIYSNPTHQTRGGGKMFGNASGYAAFEDKVMKTTDGGVTWTQVYQTGVGNPTVRSLAFPTENVGYAFFWQNTIPTWTVAKTTNGTSWSIVYQNASMEFNQYNSAMFLNESIGCIPGYNGHLYKTTNGGSSWSDIMTPEEVFRAFMVDASVIYALSGLNNANVYKTTNGGSAWVLKAIPGAAPVMDLWFQNQNTGWVCCQDGKVYRTDDGGDTWALQSTPASYLRYISFADINNGWSLGTNGMIIHTTNGGITLLPPTVVTDPATNITETTADLNGTVNANGSSTSVTFEYGLTTAYGTIVSSTPGTVTGNTNTAVMAAITGLTPNTEYHYRCVGTSSAGTTNGNDQTFTTGCNFPGNAGPITGPENVCAGSTGQVYSVDPIANATGYSWTVPPGALITNGSNTNVITVSFPAGSMSGDVTVFGTNGYGPGIPSSLAVTVNPVPPTPEITQSGNYLISDAQTGNQWYQDGIPIPGATGQAYLPINAGNYSVIVTLNGCSSEPSNTIYVDPSVGIGEIMNEILTIYPNPSNGLFTIELRQPSVREATITIYNLVGMKISEIKLPTGEAGFSKRMDLNYLPDGIYIIRISDGEKEVVTKIVIRK